jgi:hypothetical protein
VRSVLDPLPRSLSLRSLAILVSMLLLGTGISVHEYLQSGKSPIRKVRAPVATEPSFARCRDRVEGGAKPTSATCTEGAPAAPQTAPSLERILGDATSTTASPGMWEIGSGTSGG